MSREFADIWEEIRRLGLESHVAELDAVGYTVIPPEKVASPEFLERLRRAIKDAIKRRGGGNLDFHIEKPPGWFGDATWKSLMFMLFEDPVMQEASLNPVSLALADYTVGKSCMLSSCIGLVKGPDAPAMDLHTDNAALAIPAPYPPYAACLNCTWALTDYTKDGGALCVVPGSHRFGRPPIKDEGLDQRIAVEAPAGSLLVFAGGLWHGNLQRKTSGVRMTLVTVYTRPFVIPQERYREEVTDEILASNPPRFHELMGKNLYQYCFKEEGTDPEKMARLPGKTWWD